MKVLTLSGSLKRRSANKALLQRAARLVPAGVEVHLGQWIGALPHFNSELDSSEIVPIVDVWRSQVRAAEAVLISSPEYAGGMPGSLKNALDWLVSSGELSGKRVAVTCAAQGDGRGLDGLAALARTVETLDAVLVWNAPVTVPVGAVDERGELSSPEIDSALTTLLDALLGGR